MSSIELQHGQQRSAAASNGDHAITVDSDFNHINTATSKQKMPSKQKINKFKLLTDRLFSCIICRTPASPTSSQGRHSVQYPSNHALQKNDSQHLAPNTQQQTMPSTQNLYAQQPPTKLAPSSAPVQPATTQPAQQSSVVVNVDQQDDATAPVKPATNGLASLVTQVQQTMPNVSGLPNTLPQLTPAQLKPHINFQPPPVRPLLPPLSPEDAAIGKKCLVLDLDETLVHSSFKPINDADFVMTIELENVMHRVYVRKRPGVDHFLAVVGEAFEVVIFTASLAKYADPLLDILDKTKTIKARLFREHCVQHYGNYVKDLSHLGRPIQHCIIIDNSPFSYMFQPEHAIPITSWFNDKSDQQLYELLPLLDQMVQAEDICQVLSKKRFQLQQTGTPSNRMQ